MFGHESKSDIVFTDYGQDWEILRKVGFAAIRKYAVHEQLPSLVADTVDDTVAIIMKKHGSEPFDIDRYLALTVVNILAEISYGQK